MKGLLRLAALSVRLHFRSPMAMLYAYLFPTIFLVAFAVLYRHEDVPMARHMGELLTVTVLGGACFGLPTALVGERERGIWRRYRLTPTATSALLGSLVAARYLLLVPAALLQVALAMAIGMPAPAHPFDLWLAFSCVAFALLGLGLVIAMMADTVPAVQALGQCIFLPMLIIGGVAVPLAALPEWAQRLSTFFPGRYAVATLQAGITGNGLGGERSSVSALLIVGAAAIVAAAAMFRWDSQERFVESGRKWWVAVALAAWIVAGLGADPAPPPMRPGAKASPVAPSPGTAAPSDVAPPERAPTSPAPTSPAPANAPPVDRTLPGSSPAARAADAWERVTPADIASLGFDTLPPDAGVVAPIAGADEAPDEAVIRQLLQVRRGLEAWPPAHVADPAQRVRNYLYVAAVPDIFQIPLERHVPLLIFDRLNKELPRRDLVRILYWIGEHPEHGDDAALDQLHALGLGSGPADVAETRQRVSIYARKLLGRLTGRIAVDAQR